MNNVEFNQFELSQFTAIATACDAQMSEMDRWIIANPTETLAEDDKAFLAIMRAYKLLYDKCVTPYILNEMQNEEEVDGNP